MSLSAQRFLLSGLFCPLQALALQRGVWDHFGVLWRGVEQEWSGFHLLAKEGSRIHLGYAMGSGFPALRWAGVFAALIATSFSALGFLQTRRFKYARFRLGSRRKRRLAKGGVGGVGRTTLACQSRPLLVLSAGSSVQALQWAGDFRRPAPSATAFSAFGSGQTRRFKYARH